MRSCFEIFTGTNVVKIKPGTKLKPTKKIHKGVEIASNVTKPQDTIITSSPVSVTPKQPRTKPLTKPKPTLHNIVKEQPVTNTSVSVYKVSNFLQTPLNI